MSLLARLKEHQVAADQDARTAEQTHTEDRTEADAQAQAARVVSIQNNPVYQVARDEARPVRERIEAMARLKAYNPDLTPEQNAQNQKDFAEVILYMENQLLDLAQKQAAFSNDDAFSLYDNNIKILQDGLHKFKSEIGPLGDAFGVLQRARAANLPPHALLKEVQDLRDQRQALAEDIEAKEAAREKLDQSMGPMREKAEDIIHRLEENARAMQTLTARKQKADEVVAEQSKRLFFLRDRVALDDAQKVLARVAVDLEAAQRSREDLRRLADTAASVMEDTENKAKAVDEDLAAARADLETRDQALSDDRDMVAIGKLLDITGPAFKEKRDDLTGNVRSLITNTVADFERSIGRFRGGLDEVRVMSHTVSGVSDLNDLILVAARDADEADSSTMMGLEGTLQAIKDDKGDDAVLDPTYEKTRKQLHRTRDHVALGRGTATKAAEFKTKLTRQKASYEGLEIAFDQKARDAERLRTHTAVEVSSKLLTSIKGLELAIASERTAAADDILRELSDAATETTKGIFDMVSKGASEENDRLVQGLEQVMETSEAITGIIADLQQATEDRTLHMHAANQAVRELDDITDDLQGVVNRTQKAVASREDLDEAAARAAAEALARRRQGG